ncbi:MAG: agmatinase [Methanosarcinaceae archaeon]|nr:agmatinase [Methanosarcinaceae archaeon]
MFNQPKMMDAPSKYGTAEYVIFGVPFDGTSSFRAGSRFAPGAMRKASANFESYNAFFDIDLAELPIHDAGDLEPYASVSDTLRDLFYAVEPIAKDGKIPIMLGGEHSLSLPCVKACAKYAGDDFGVVVLDAHFDLRDEYGGLKNNHACVSRHIIDEVTDNYVSIGIRSGPKEEWDLAKENNIRYYTSEDVETKGIKDVLAEVIEYFDCSKIYLSLDMDALDPSFAPALGTPEPFGLNARDVREVIRTLAPMSVGFDIVEIAPEYDGGQTAMLGTKLMREFIAAHASSVLD